MQSAPSDSKANWPIIVIVEGPPRVGKTNNVDAFKEAVVREGLSFVHHPTPITGNLVNLTRLLTTGLVDKAVNIFDGFHLRLLAKMNRWPQFTMTNDLLAFERLLDDMAAIKVMIEYDDLTRAARGVLRSSRQREYDRFMSLTRQIEEYVDGEGIAAYKHMSSNATYDYLLNANRLAQLLDRLKGEIGE